MSYYGASAMERTMKAQEVILRAMKELGIEMIPAYSPRRSALTSVALRAPSVSAERKARADISTCYKHRFAGDLTALMQSLIKLVRQGSRSLRPPEGVIYE